MTERRNRVLQHTDSDSPKWEASYQSEGVEVRFYGRTGASTPVTLTSTRPALPDALSWLKQVHATDVIQAAEGLCGEGDALVTSSPQLALVIATADCVPVLLTDGRSVAAAHAGWRGLTAGVLPAAIAHLDPTGLQAWIGPAIGPCCYEIGEDVATALAEASEPGLILREPGRRPHADLIGIAAHQLSQHGVETIHRVDLCTRCNSDKLWSYRRDGDQAGRNWSLIWKR